MFINDVIRLVRNYYPSEYTLSEMYMWCDEVSSMLTIEDRNIFKSIELPVAADGSVLLPEGLTFEYIESVYANGKRLNKTDYRDYGYRKMHLSCVGEYAVNNPKMNTQYITLNYLQPYIPIRLCKYDGAVDFDIEQSEFKIKHCDFRPGDTLIFQITDPAAEDEDNNIILLDKIPLLSLRYNDETLDGYICTVPQGSFDNLDLHYDNCVITRHVTEKTVCDAPFDSMYVDYLLAKICYYQKDISSYNQHMTAFNSRLDAYKRWLVDRLPQKKSQFINWW